MASKKRKVKENRNNIILAITLISLFSIVGVLFYFNVLQSSLNDIAGGWIVNEITGSSDEEKVTAHIISIQPNPRSVQDNCGSNDFESGVVVLNGGDNVLADYSFTNSLSTKLQDGVYEGKVTFLDAGAGTCDGGVGNAELLRDLDNSKAVCTIYGQGTRIDCDYHVDVTITADGIPRKGVLANFRRVAADIVIPFEGITLEQPTKYYRFANNECTEIEILPSAKTDNDYISKDECEKLIVITTNNDTNDTQDDMTDDTSNDSSVDDTSNDANETTDTSTDADTSTTETELSCWKDSNIIEQSLFGSADCSMVKITDTACKGSDGYYVTQQECLDNIEDPFSLTMIIIVSVTVLAVIAVIIIIVYNIFLRRRKRR